MDRFTPLILPIVQEALSWAQAAEPPRTPPEHLCETRDVLGARLDRCRNEAVRAGMPDPSSSLLRAILGEIGGNSFDHNLGAWKDVPGSLLRWEAGKSVLSVVLADRGQGILHTIRRVKPSVASHGDALKTAFLERLSGRAPERRGNGLKFVRRILLKDGPDFFFQSGDASYVVRDGTERWEPCDAIVPGCIAVVSWVLQ